MDSYPKKNDWKKLLNKKVVWIPKRISHPQFASLESRQKSYQLWRNMSSPDIALSTYATSRAGFFARSPFSKDIICYYCGIKKEFKRFPGCPIAFHDGEECPFVRFHHFKEPEFSANSFSQTPSPLCSVCVKSEKCFMALPCFHYGFCWACATETTNCITCGLTIVGFVKFTMEE